MLKRPRGRRMCGGSGGTSSNARLFRLPPLTRPSARPPRPHIAQLKGQRLCQVAAASLHEDGGLEKEEEEEEKLSAKVPLGRPAGGPQTGARPAAA